MSLLAAMMAGAANRGILSQATNLWQAKNYSGSGDWLDEKGTANFQFGSSSGADTNDPLWLPHSTAQNPFGAGVKYIATPGTTSNNVTTPDSATLDLTGDVTMVCRIAPDTYTPAATQAMFGKWNSGQASYWINILTTGVVRVSTTANGSATVVDDSTVTLPSVGATDGQAIWIAASKDLDDGAGNRVTKIWYSFTDTNDPDAATWTQLGATITSTATTLFSGTGIMSIAGLNDGTTNPFAGKIARAMVYSGLRDFSSTPTGGTLVMDFNPSSGQINSNQTQMNGSDNLLYTINRSSSGLKLSMVDRDKFLLGTDDRFQMDSTASATMPWLGDEQPFTNLVLFKHFGTTIGGGRIIFGSGRASVTNVAGVSISSDFSNRIRMSVSDGSGFTLSSLNGISAYNGYDTNYAVAYDPAAESMNTITSTSGGGVITDQLASGLTDRGIVSNSTDVRIGWQSVDNNYVAMEFIAAATFNRVLTADEMQQAMKELTAQPAIYVVADTFNGPNNEAVAGRASDVGGATWGNVATIAPLLDGSGAVKLTSDGQTSARVLMPTGNNKVTTTMLGGSGGSVSSRVTSATVRHTDQNNLLHMWVRASDGAVAIRKRVSGTFTTLASATASGLSNTTPYTVTIEAEDDVIRGYVNGTLLITHTLSAGDYTTFPNTITGAGFWFSGFSSTRCNDFEAESI